MNTRTSLSVFAFVGLLAASQSLLAAAPKTDARANALVAALQAVSPDPLGGRLGLAASAEHTTSVSSAPAGQVAVKSSRDEADHRAYLVWKSAQKS